MRWLYRLLFGAIVLIIIFIAVLKFSFNRPHVNQSTGFTNATEEAIDATVSKSLPASAVDVRYIEGSIGPGGRLTFYRFSAPIDDLHAHANAEFEAITNRANIRTSMDVMSPITQRIIDMENEAFGIRCEWMLAPADAIGTIYDSADDHGNSQPIIFIDEVNSVLYFKLTD